MQKPYSNCDKVEAYLKFAESYMDSAVRLYNIYINQPYDCYRKNTIIMPLLFLCRSAVELIMKTCLQVVGETCNNHNLIDIFENVVKCYSIVDNVQVVDLRSFLQEYSNIDNASDRFRYPFSKVDSFSNKDNRFSYYKIMKTFGDLFEYFKNIYNKGVDNNFKCNTCYSIRYCSNNGSADKDEAIMWNNSYNKDFNPYIYSYIWAAQMLNECDSGIEARILREDDMPILVLLRTAFELSIKRVYGDKNIWSSGKIEEIREHDMSILYTKIVDYIKDGHNSEEDFRWFSNIERTIWLWIDISKDDKPYRYPIDKKGAFYKIIGCAKLNVSELVLKTEESIEQLNIIAEVRNMENEKRCVLMDDFRI